MNSFDTTAAYQIAKRMIRSALQRGRIYYPLTEQDHEDLLQEAVTEMWRAAVVSGRTDERWLAGAARQAIFRFLARVWFGRTGPRPGHTMALDDAERLASPCLTVCASSTESDEKSSLEAVLAEVWQRFYATRRKKGRRGEMITDTEIGILYLLLKGYGTAAIAVTLGIKEHTVKIYRARIRRKLLAWRMEEDAGNAEVKR